MNYLLSEDRAGQALQHGNTAAAAHVDDWKTQMISTYRQRRQYEDSALRIALAQRVRALTGHEVDADAIWVDLDERLALTTVDGVRFRWEQSQLVVLRPCALCGGGQFASPPLTSQADVGYALSAWQPRHPQCQPDDPVSGSRPRRKPMFNCFTGNGVVWSDGRQEVVDSVIFATGYRPNLNYLTALGTLDETGDVLQRRGLSTSVPGLGYVGLARQRNLASATLRGVGADAKIVVDHLRRYCQAQKRRSTTTTRTPCSRDHFMPQT